MTCKNEDVTFVITVTMRKRWVPHFLGMLKYMERLGGLGSFTASDLWSALQNALARRQRWNDDSYLTRIIFCEMIFDDVNGETGFGISTSPPDNEHPYLTVDVGEQRVIVEGGGSYTFEEYLELTKDPRL